MDILRYILPVAASIMLTSCFQEFEPDIDSTPVLCMNSEIVSGEPIKVRLTRTWRWDEGDPNAEPGINKLGIDIEVTDARMTISVNDSEPIEMERRILDNGLDIYHPAYEEEPYFVADGIIPKPGDRIKFTAISEKYGEATAEVIMPRAVEIDHVDITPSNVYGEDMFGNIVCDLDIQLWFTDPADGTDYYKFSYASSKYQHDPETDAISYLNGFWIDTSHEPLFSEHVSSLESIGSDTSGYTIFTDRQISGRPYGLHLSAENIRADYRNPENNPDITPPTLYLTLNAISQSYYNHVLSVWVANDGLPGALGSIGLGEAVFAASNVSTHAGVVAARTPSTVSIDILKVIASYKQ